MSLQVILSVVLIFTLCAAVGAADAVYHIVDHDGEFVGAWDVNMLADDVHFEVPSIIREIRMPMAIAGLQTCTLWIFDNTNSPPLYTAAFSNQLATTNSDSTVYVFEMNLQVPKDIYLGFSAQGDGWGLTESDYWGRGYIVRQGIPGTAGEYYYGPVSGGQLTTSYASGDASFGALEILSQPVQITSLESVTGQVRMAVSSLPIYASNVVERSESVGGTNWLVRGALPVGEAAASWSESGPESSAQFYRVKSR